jgi:hypothetical protein
MFARAPRAHEIVWVWRAEEIEVLRHENSLSGGSVEVGARDANEDVTDGSGAYLLNDLRPGQYKVTFTLPGFTTVVRDPRRTQRPRIFWTAAQICEGV